VQPDIEAERKKRDEIEAGKSYCSRRFGGATCDDKSAQIYARFDKNDWRIQPAEFYRFHDAEVNTFGYLDRKSGSAGMPRPISYAVFCLKKKSRKINNIPTSELQKNREFTHNTQKNNFYNQIYVFDV